MTQTTSKAPAPLRDREWMRIEQPAVPRILFIGSPQVFSMPGFVSQVCSPTTWHEWTYKNLASVSQNLALVQESFELF